jgi:hypothetical protein
MITRPHLQVVTSNGKIVEDTCYHRTRMLRHVDELRLDDVEQVFLELFRELCTNLFDETPERVAVAHDRVVKEFGPSDGSRLVYGTVDLVYAIRSERKNEFSYMPPECPVCNRHVSNEEWTTLMLVRAARRGDNAALSEMARLLTEDGVTIAVAMAAVPLGAVMEGVAHRQQAARRLRPEMTRR